MSEHESDLSIRFKAIETALNSLLIEAKTNHRIIIVALAIMAAGKEILTIIK